MTSDRTRFTLRIALCAATAILILAGATLNVSGRSGQEALIAAVAGLLALLAGVLNRMWKAAVPLGVAAIVLTFFTPPFRPLDIGGLLLLGLGGLAGSLAYRSFTDALRRHRGDVTRLNAQLQEKHRAFMAATSDADSMSPPGDVAALTSNIAQQIGSGFACYFLASPDGKQFVPQPPGIGLERLHPQAVNRVPGAAGPLMAASNGVSIDLGGASGEPTLQSSLPGRLNGSNTSSSGHRRTILPVPAFASTTMSETTL